MKIEFIFMLGFIFSVNAVFAETVSVSGRANPWLAGMTNGSTARRGDSAPEESPVAVTATPITGGVSYIFSASGSVNHGAPTPFFPPDGEDLISHYLGAENGIADITVPFDSLIGVFLGPQQPDQNPPPPPLDFRDSSERDYVVLVPALKQPFFIGDGLTSSGVVQQVIAPRGATRLFLGVMDEYAWFDNQGAFTVQIDRSSKIQLSLHPALNPTTADAVANTAVAILERTSTTTATPDSAPTIAGPELHAYTAIELSWPSQTNQFYQVQWTPSLNPHQWVNFGPVLSGSGTNVSIFDSTRAHTQGFYRVQIVLL